MSAPAGKRNKFSSFHAPPSSSLARCSYLHVQEFAAGAGFADVVVEVEAGATATGQVAWHALKVSGLRGEAGRKGAGEGGRYGE